MFNSRQASPLIMPGRKHFEVPKLMVGFDTETTGLFQEPDQNNPGKLRPRRDIGQLGYGLYNLSDPQPVSYGLVVYRNGKRSHEEDEHFLVRPRMPSDRSGREMDIDPKVSEVNGWGFDDLKRSFSGEKISGPDSEVMHPALHPKVGLDKIIGKLADYHRQGAVFVGSNPNYDYHVLASTYKRYNGLPIISGGLDLDGIRNRTVDTVKHEDLIDPRPEGMKRDDPEYRSHGLEALCDKYDVTPGGHAALSDSAAAVNVFLKQIRANNGEKIHPTTQNTTNTPYRFNASLRSAATVGRAGIDYEQISPWCTGEDCLTCRHLDEAVEANKDKDGRTINKKDKKTIDRVRKIHKGDLT